MVERLYRRPLIPLSRTSGVGGMTDNQCDTDDDGGDRMQVYQGTQGVVPKSVFLER